ncbi:porin [Bordetella trematum]|uniref:porin n=1 Tax=Bordetella trematum TaxID=123899 RepID=UPI000F63BC8A|nr:porin [Bordetella trematum]VDH02953.1 Outer membrane porin protein BP0840 precursor [Bordetella trematum]
MRNSHVAAWAATLIACASTPVWSATSSLKLSGSVDMGLRVTTSDDSRRLRTVSGGRSSSYIALSGVEELGGGWRTSFTLQTLFNMGNGKLLLDGQRFNGEASVGLEGPYGELRLGRQVVMGGQWGSIDAGFDGGWGGAGDLVMPAGYGDTGYAALVDNSVFYFSPKLGSFSLAGGYSFGVRDNDDEKKRRRDHLFTAGVQYANGPWSAALTLDGLLPRDKETRHPTRNYQATVAYEPDGYAVSIGVGRLYGISRGVAAKKGYWHAYTLGGRIDVGGAGKLRMALQYGPVLNFYSVATGYQYDLSKRTSLYAYVIRRFGGPFARELMTVGMRHRF